MLLSWQFLLNVTIVRESIILNKKLFNQSLGPSSMAPDGSLYYHSLFLCLCQLEWFTCNDANYELFNLYTAPSTLSAIPMVLWITEVRSSIRTVTVMCVCCYVCVDMQLMDAAIERMLRISTISCVVWYSCLLLLPSFEELCIRSSVGEYHLFEPQN